MATTQKNLDYYRKNAEEDYLTTPISVLRYISEMEAALRQPPVMCCGLTEVEFTERERLIELQRSRTAGGMKSKRKASDKLSTATKV